MGLPEGIVEFTVKKRLRQFGLLDDLFHVLEEIFELVLLLLELLGNFVFLLFFLKRNGFVFFRFPLQLPTNLFLTFRELAGIPAYFPHFLGELTGRLLA